MAELTPEQKQARKLLPYYILIVVLGFIFIRWGWPALNAFVQKQSRDVALLIYLGILALLGLSGLPVGLYGFRLARRMTATGQVPPRMKQFMWRSNLEEGAFARRTGRLFYFISFVLILCSFGIVTLSYKLYRSFTLH